MKRSVLALGIFLSATSLTFADDKPNPNMSVPPAKENTTRIPESLLSPKFDFSNPIAPYVSDKACYPPTQKPAPLVG